MCWNEEVCLLYNVIVATALITVVADQNKEFVVFINRETLCTFVNGETGERAEQFGYRTPARS
jgi:hypothetical protein